ncbi:MAG: Stk1 family PASTA domain-containing Ser/Thr kinase [Bacilli bacterium]|nr:Stk1 family PASTA domain-containing Ser/Thr kinase [Bacilli bacterium]
MSRINQIIAGRYIIKELIGQGGMADVYLAEDKILERVVAIKLLRSSLTGDPVYITRFHREASAAAALSHKNIVQIYDVGEEDDNYYIVMEYVPGQTLKELIYKRGALHYVEAIDIMKQVVSATAKAHSMGIIHRDLKPQNILVTDSGVVKIADFGIASIQSLSQVTQTDTIMGSLHYLAPEIARGEKATVQSDLYALGIVFYELLRGEVPFNGESPVNIALKHMRDEIPSLRAFNPSIPQSVENIVIKATAKNIKDRYSFAKEMFEDLSTCMKREKEEKLVFTYQEEQEPTIIADNEKFFTKSTEEIKTEEVEEKPKKKSNKKYAVIGGIIGAVVLIGFVIYFAFIAGGNNFPMPNVVGLIEDEAIEILVEKELEVDETQTIRELSDEYEEGYVISTNPISNSSVKEGDSVVITVSSGKYIVVDDYVGKDYDDVKESLEALGFEVNKEEVASEETIGKIVGQSLLAQQKYDPHTQDKEITLQVSKGIEISVPNVYGQSITEAKALLESSEYGFKVKLEVLTPPTTASEIETMKLNVVMTQSIKAFTKMTKKLGTEITLGYYDTRPEIPVDEPDDTDVPEEPAIDNPETE